VDDGPGSAPGPGPAPQLATLVAHDGLPLRTAVWPAPSDARGSVVLLQGRAEFIEKYGETVGDLLARRFAVYALDWRGQGHSGRVLTDTRKGHVVSYEDYLSDLALFLERVVLPAAPRPIVVLAHSMGGHIVLRHRAEHDARSPPGAPYFADGIVLSAPMVDIRMTPAERALGAVLTVAAVSVGLRNRYVPVWSPFPPPYEGNPLTRERARYARMERLMHETPTLAIGWPTVGWLAATRRSVAILRSPGYPERIATPVLMVSAAADRVVSNAAQARLAARMPACRLETIPDSRHEPLMETDDVRARILALFDEFVDEVLEPARH
jgi:lysophospholipase